MEVELGEFGSVLDIVKSKLSKKYKERFFNAVETVGKDTARDIAGDAGTYFSTAEYDGKVSDADILCAVDSETFTVHGDRAEYEATVVAEGKAVRFIEFGTSINDTGTHEWQDAYGYSKGERGKDRWWFKTDEPVQLTATGEQALAPKRKDGSRRVKKNVYYTKGNKPNRCLYNATVKNRRFVKSRFEWEMKKR